MKLDRFLVLEDWESVLLELMLDPSPILPNEGEAKLDSILKICG